MGEVGLVIDLEQPAGGLMEMLWREGRNCEPQGALEAALLVGGGRDWRR